MGTRSSWNLAVDFGTTYTTAATMCQGRLEVLEVDGSSRLPSLVLLNEEGRLVVGQAALRQSVLAPERVERTPKRYLGEAAPLVLGGHPVEVVDAVGAVLGVVWAEAARRHGGVPPDEVRLTHPARWQEQRLAALVEAAARAGIRDPVLLAEPVAAAAHFAGKQLASGDAVAVYDLGGGTFDTAVLRRTEQGFALIGKPGGIDLLGGETFDQRLYEHLGQILQARDHALWNELRNSPQRQWRKANDDLLGEARRAKEALSRDTTYNFYLGAPVDQELQVTRSELERLIRPDLESTLVELSRTIAGSDVAVEQIKGIYLAGGSSRIPLVARLVADRFGRVPDMLDEPKAVVALGAARADGLGVAYRDAVPTQEVNTLTPAPPPTGTSPPPTVLTTPEWGANSTSRAGGTAGRPPGASPEKRDPKHRRRKLIGASIGVTLAAALTALVVFLWPAGSTGNPEERFSFPVVDLDGVTMQRTWRLSGEQGTEFAGELRFENTTEEKLPRVHVEVIPKSLAADVSAITFGDIKPEVVKADPVVSYAFTLDPKAVVTFSYQVEVPPEGLGQDRLKLWAEDQEQERVAFEETVAPPPEPIPEEVALPPTPQLPPTPEVPSPPSKSSGGGGRVPVASGQPPAPPEEPLPAPPEKPPSRQGTQNLPPRHNPGYPDVSYYAVTGNHAYWNIWLRPDAFIDPEGDQWKIYSAGNGAYGTASVVTCEEDTVRGCLRYTPYDPSYSGYEDTFTYRVWDPGGSGQTGELRTFVICIRC